MTDHRTRTAERAALDGDPQAAARALQAHLRATAGPWQACACGGRKHCSGHGVRVESCAFCVCPRCPGTGRVRMAYEDRVALLAYVGDVGARELAGEACSCGLGPNDATELCLDQSGGFGEWINGLTRWPGAWLRATCAAARVVLDRDEPTARASGTLTYSFDAARQAVEAAEALRDCPCEAHRVACERLLSCGTPIPTFSYHLLAEAVRSDANKVRFCVAECVRRADEPTVRAAICADLIKWALA